MKVLKLILFTPIIFFFVDMHAMHGYEFGVGCEGYAPKIIRSGTLATMREEREKIKAEQSEAEEARITSSYIREIAGNALIDSLLKISDREKTLELNKLSTNVKERLIELIIDRRKLLDKNDDEEFKTIKKLRDLRDFIEENLNH